MVHCTIARQELLHCTTLGAVLCTVFTMISNKKRFLGGRRTPAPMTTQSYVVEPRPRSTADLPLRRVGSGHVGLPSTVSYLLQALLNSSLNFLCIHTWWQSGIGIIHRPGCWPTSNTRVMPFLLRSSCKTHWLSDEAHSGVGGQ